MSKSRCSKPPAFKESTPVESEKLTQPGLAPGSQWTMKPGIQSKDSIGPVFCPLCRRSNTVTLAEIRQGAPGSKVEERVYVCNYDCASHPHEFVI